MVIELLRIFAILCVAAVCGKIVAKVKLPAILGWLIAGVIFGPYLAEIVTQETIGSTWYQIMIKFFECFAGVMIGREIIFKKLASSGKQIVGITFIQSIGTFLFVTIVFSIVFLIVGVPLYLAFIFGGIALATAPAPALSIVNEYHTEGPVTKTLIPLAAIDDVIGVIVFFSVISIVSGMGGSSAESPLVIIGIVGLPFVIGIVTGVCGTFFMKRVRKNSLRLLLFIAFLCISVGCGLGIDYSVFHSFRLNYLLIGMAFSGVTANLLPEKEMGEVLKLYRPILDIALVIVIVNLGMPLDYRLIAGAGLYTIIYILSRAIGKIGGAYIGGKVTKADATVTKYLGLTLLPHSGVSLIFTGIAVATLTTIDSSLAAIVSGTIVAAAIINEVIAVIFAKFAFYWAGEIKE